MKPEKLITAREHYDVSADDTQKMLAVVVDLGEPAGEPVGEPDNDNTQDAA